MNMNIKSISQLNEISVYTQPIIDKKIPNDDINASYLPKVDDFIKSLTSKDPLYAYIEIAYNNKSLKLDFLKFIYWIFNRIECRINELSTTVTDHFVHISGENNIGNLQLSGSLAVDNDITCTYLINTSALTATYLTATNLTATDLSATDLTATELSATDLTAADLSATDLTAADLSATDLSATHLIASHLTCTTNPAQLTAYAAQWR